MKDDFLGLQALTKNLVFFLEASKAVYLHSSSTIVLNLNEVYLPHVDIELVDSAYISAGLSWV